MVYNSFRQGRSTDYVSGIEIFSVIIPWFFMFFCYPIPSVCQCMHCVGSEGLESTEIKQKVLPDEIVETFQEAGNFDACQGE